MSPKVPTPVRRFRVFPERRTTLYWTVEVYSNLRDMRLAYALYRGIVNSNMKDTSRLGPGRKAQALCAGTTIIKFPRKRPGHPRRGRISPSMGVIFLSLGYVGGGIVSHEACHAARYYFERLKVPLQRPEMDERFAYAVGDIVRAIARRVW